MRLEKIRDFEDLKNFETRRDETRFSSRREMSRDYAIFKL